MQGRQGQMFEEINEFELTGSVRNPFSGFEGKHVKSSIEDHTGSGGIDLSVMDMTVADGAGVYFLLNHKAEDAKVHAGADLTTDEARQLGEALIEMAHRAETHE